MGFFVGEVNVFFEGVPEIVSVVFSKPYTIVKWDDETTTIVRCEGDIWDKEKGLAMAVTKKAMGGYTPFDEALSSATDVLKDYPPKND